MKRLAGADVLVVGGGTAGCVVAARLAASGRSTMLLEAGPDLRRALPPGAADGWRLPVVPDWGFESQPRGGGAPQRLRRGRLLGGTSWLTRFAVRGAAADFDAWAAAGNPGWAFDDVLPAFRRLERDVDFGDLAWHGDAGPIPIDRYLDLPPSGIHAAALEALAALGFPSVADHNAPGAVGVGRMPMSTRAGVRVTTADAYLGHDRHADLTIRADAQVDRVVVVDGRAVGVRLLDGTTLAADEMILAAGTYGSPTILMRSGIGPADDLRATGLGVVVDLPGVGSNLADHPAVDLDSGWHDAGSAGPIAHSIATFRSSTAGLGEAPDLMFWATDPDAADPGFYLDPILLKPHSRGSVRLRSADPAAAPLIELPALREEADIRRLVEGQALGLEMAAHPAIRALCRDPIPDRPAGGSAARAAVLENAYSIPHVVGTCAMGPDPAAGAVVDHLGRVHGVAGLRVIDASIIPEPPSGFPHLITIMLAEHIVARLVDSSS